MFTNERLFTIQAFTITRVHCTYSTSDLRPTIKWHMAKMLLEQNFDLGKYSSNRNLFGLSFIWTTYKHKIKIDNKYFSFQKSLISFQIDLWQYTKGLSCLQQQSSKGSSLISLLIAPCNCRLPYQARRMVWNSGRGVHSNQRPLEHALLLFLLKSGEDNCPHLPNRFRRPCIWCTSHEILSST